MRLLKINYYPKEYINYLYNKYPYVKKMDYRRQLDLFFYESYAWGDSWTYYLKPYGYETEEVIINSSFLQNRWLKEEGIKKKLNTYEIVFNQVNKFKPDILWYDHYDPILLKGIKENCPFIKLIINWVGSAITNYEVFRYSDIVLSCAKESVEILQKEGIRAYHLNHAFDKRILERVKKKSKKNDLIFIGQLIKTNEYHKERERFLEKLCKNVNIKIYTPSIYEYKFSFKRTIKTFLKRVAYDLVKNKFFNLLNKIPFFYKISQLKDKPEYNFKFQFSKDLKKVLRKGVYGLEMFEKIYESKIVLNIHADTSPHYTSNMRLFEVTGVGSLLLTDWKKNISDFFEEDEVITYKNYEEAIEKIRWLLDNPKKIEEIAQKGQNKTLTKNEFNSRIKEFDYILKVNL